MKKLSFALALIFTASIAIGQGYFTAAGLRAGDGFGMTIQQRVAKKVSAEAILKNNKRRDEFMITGLVQRHVPIISRKLNFYTGIGLHQGFVNSPNAEKPYKNPFGITGVAGLEFTMGSFNLSYDFKPAINLTGGAQTIYPETALSLRYVLVKDKYFKQMTKKKKKKQRQKERDKKRKNGESIFSGLFGKN